MFDEIASVCFMCEKKICIYIFRIGNGQSREPALCQLYRHTFVPYNDDDDDAQPHTLTVTPTLTRGQMSRKGANVRAEL